MIHRVVVVLLLCLMQPAVAEDAIAVVGSGVRNSIRWQQEWFGESYGASCFGLSDGDQPSLRVFVPHDSNGLPPRNGAIPNIAVHVGNSGVLYTGTLWSGKANLEPSLASAEPCKSKEIQDRIGGLESSFWRFEGSLLPAAEGKKGEISADTHRLVSNYVSRSMDEFGRSHYGAKFGVLRLARYSLDDPMLIVVDQARSEVFLLEFPPIGFLQAPAIGSVFAGEIFLGPDVESEHRKAVREGLLRRAIERSSEIKR